MEFPTFLLAFKISVVLLGLSFSQHAVHEGIGFRYFPFASSVKLLILTKVGHDCYVYNSTAQNRSDMHDPVKMLAVEGRLLQMVSDRDTYFRNISKWHYQHDLHPYNNMCDRGHSTLWLYKGPVAAE